MSIIDETFKRLGEEGGQAPASSSNGATDLRFVVGARKRRPTALLLAVGAVVSGIVVYALLPEVPPPAAAVAPAPSVAAQSAVVPAAISGDLLAATEPQGVIPPPSWYESGWNGARAEQWSDAFTAWEQGIRSLPADRMVITSNSYTDLAAFNLALRQHAEMFPAIGVRQRHYSGQMMYRLLVFPYGGGTREILPKVQALFPQAALANASGVQILNHATQTATALSPAPMSARVEVLPAPAPTPAYVPAEQAVTSSPLTAAKPAAEAVPSKQPVFLAVASGNNWEERSNAIREQLKAESYTDVIKNAKALAQDYSERFEPWFWLGSAQLALGQMDAADASLERAGELNPKVAQIWIQRAIVAQERGDHAAAIRLLTEARTLSPKSPQIYLNLGYSHEALGQAEEAERNFIRFLSLTEGDDSYWQQRKPVINRLEEKR
ncbi:MAG: tetratricopeptide repeat protein [Gallionella sp.]|nr:tetratricopeptide repeat protein [Gallionella sp.]